MADLPKCPRGRTEEYLADIAGLSDSAPDKPWSRKEAYLDAIDQHVEGMEGDIAKNKQDISDLNQKVAALATDFSYKGSVADYAHLPSDPAIGDVYTTEDEGYMYVWDGTRWQILNMTGAGALTGNADPTSSTEGTLGQLYLNTTSGKLFYCSATSPMTWQSLDAPIQSISVNGTPVAPDVDKNVALTIPTVNNATLTITQNGTSVGTFTANASTDATIALTDTTYSAFTGATASTAGASGLVPAPAAGDESKVLKGDGTWAVPEGGIKTLTSADYNWHETGSVDNSVALWLLPAGVYKIPYEMVNSVFVNNSKTKVSIGNNETALVYITQATNGRWIFYPGYDSSKYTYGLGAAQVSSGSGQIVSNFRLLPAVENNLTSTSAASALSANQGRVLKDLIDSLVIKNAGAPTTSTVGTVGMLYEDTTNGKLYQCTAIDNTDPQAIVYTWTEVGGGSGPTVVQTTGTSQTDVMSQAAASQLVYPSGYETSKIRIVIGDGASAQYSYGVAIGRNARTSASRGVAIGEGAKAYHGNSVALGGDSETTAGGQLNIGCGITTNGYNNSAYRLLSGVYDPQSAHDAATKGYVDGTTETLTIADTDWSALSSSDPYTYSATVSVTATIGANSTVELINDNAVSFGTYGFAIGSVDQPNNQITVYSIGSPSASVNLKINVKGA